MNMHRSNLWIDCGYWTYLLILIPYCANAARNQVCEYYNVRRQELGNGSPLYPHTNKYRSVYGAGTLGTKTRVPAAVKSYAFDRGSHNG